MAEADLDHWIDLGMPSCQRWAEINGGSQRMKDEAATKLEEHHSTLVHALRQKRRQFKALGKTGRADFYQGLLDAVTGYHHLQRVNMSYAELARVTHDLGEDREVVLNCPIIFQIPVLVAPGNVQEIDMLSLLSNGYSSQGSKIREAANVGIQQGAEDLVREFEDPKGEMLRVFTRDYFVGRGELLADPSIHGLVKYETRFKGVDIRYQFPPNQDQAFIFLKVNDLPRED